MGRKVEAGPKGEAEAAGNRGVRNQPLETARKGPPITGRGHCCDLGYREGEDYG